MLLSDEQIAGVNETVDKAPRHVDPLLSKDVHGYTELILCLWRAGVLCMLPSVKIVGGLLFVTKKSGQLRLIYDARVNNQRFRQPPSGEVSTMASVCEIELGSEELLICSEDIENAFHRMLVPEGMSEYLGLPPVAKECLEQIGAEANMAGATLERWKQEIACCSDMVFPAYRALPMGFSWSFFFAQEAHRAIAQTHIPSSQNKHVELLEQVGFKTHEVEGVDNQGETLGERVDGVLGRVESKRDRQQRVMQALLAIERGTPVSGKELRVVLGHVLNVMLKRRPVWANVRKELHCIRVLIPFMFRDLRSVWSDCAYMVDASPSGLCVMSRMGSPEDNAQEGRWQERWRFKRLPPDQWKFRDLALANRD
eukprot:3817405-Amphidinium_carterae.1